MVGHLRPELLKIVINYTGAYLHVHGLIKLKLFGEYYV